MALNKLDYFNLGYSAYSDEFKAAPAANTWQRKAWDEGLAKANAEANPRPARTAKKPAEVSPDKMREQVAADMARAEAAVTQLPNVKGWPRAAAEHAKVLVSEINAEPSVARRNRLKLALNRMAARWVGKAL